VECWKAIDYGIGNLAWLLPAKVFTEGKFGF